MEIFFHSILGNLGNVGGTFGQNANGTSPEGGNVLSTKVAPVGCCYFFLHWNVQDCEVVI